MHVLVVGAGLLGVSTAYFLRQHGVEVTVLDSQATPALGASHGNGGFAQVSVADPWNAPGVFGVFTKAWLNSLSGRGDSSAYNVRTTALPGLIGWGIQFLRNANQKTYVENTIKNSRLAAYTQRTLDELHESETLSYSQSQAGSLLVFRSAESLEEYRQFAEKVCAERSSFSVLAADELVAKEPALTDVSGNYAGAVFFPDDCAGNSRHFCEQLAAITRAQGVEYYFNSAVRKIRLLPTGVQVDTVTGPRNGDSVVIAAGVYSRRLAAPLGIQLPIAPAKGYSISIPMTGWSPRPTHAIADMGVHAGITPLGDILRVAGTAEFAGMRPGITAKRIEYLISLARQLFPGQVQSIDQGKIAPWNGHRPLSVDGMPMIGPSGVNKVFVNSGHGGLGWTQAAGSGKALADHIVGADNAFDLTDFSISRF